MRCIAILMLADGPVLSAGQREESHGSKPISACARTPPRTFGINGLGEDVAADGGRAETSRVFDVKCQSLSSNRPHKRATEALQGATNR